MKNKKIKELIEDLVIEKLSQDEAGVEQTPGGKYLIEKFKKDKEFAKIYEDYKNNKK